MRLQVNVSDSLAKQIDEYAEAIGMSRSSLCAYFIGQGMFNINKGLELASGALEGYAKLIANADKGSDGKPRT